MTIRTAALALAIALGLQAGIAAASSPLTSLRPIPRPVAEAVVATVDPGRAEAMRAASTRRAVSVSMRPAPRPDVAEAVARAVAVERPAARVVLASSAGAVQVSPRPDARPENVERRGNVVRAGFIGRIFGPANPRPGEGTVCNDPQIVGERMQRISGRLAGCGVEQPVRVTSVAGVQLSQASVMTCETATALKHWIIGGVQPAIGRLGGGLAALKVAAHYSCRTRNHQPGARISEHGKGKAIDISAVILRNGVSISVLKGWDDPQHARMMRAMHSSACGPFGTVLGPESDRFHKDHFHFDTARHRSGPYCR